MGIDKEALAEAVLDVLKNLQDAKKDLKTLDDAVEKTKGQTKKDDQGKKKEKRDEPKSIKFQPPFGEQPEPANQDCVQCK